MPQSTLLDAVIKLDWDLAKRLLQDADTASINDIVETGPHRGKSVLWFAVVHMQWDIVSKLLNRDDLDSTSINAIAQEGSNKGVSVLLAAANHNQWEVVKDLLNKGLNLASINTVWRRPNGVKHTAFDQAILAKKWYIARLLIEKGCDVDSFLKYFENRDIIKELLKFPPDIIEKITDGGSEDRYSKKYECPLSHCLMLYPVTMSDGYTYDLEFILKHLENSDVSPMNRMKIGTAAARPAINQIIKNDIITYISTVGTKLLQEKHNAVLSKYDSTTKPPRPRRNTT